MASMRMVALKATKKGAGVVAEKAIQNLQKHTMTAGSKSTGELESSIGIMRQRFDLKNEVGWLAAVLDEPYSDWEKTLGARAVFLEYGHALPDGGRKPGRSRKSIIKSVRPYPFFRPALRSSYRVIHKIMEKEILKSWK